MTDIDYMISGGLYLLAIVIALVITVITRKHKRKRGKVNE